MSQFITPYHLDYQYTHLGQLWQGPLNGTGGAQQYLSCDSTHPHQLTGLYPLGTTCSTKGSATPTYSASYDPWGNQTSRTYNSVTATLSYDIQNQLVEWNAGSSYQGYYAYDSTGERTLQRSITSSGTSITVYAFGLEEHLYGGSGTPTSSTYYYGLSGHLISSTNGSSTQFYLTDALGSILESFSDIANTASVLGNQAFVPYGSTQYQSGSIGTAKGFTGQYQDPSGLDYDHARYYDPVVGLFISADSVQSNQQGMNPYAYVGGNPETDTDPTGQRVLAPDGSTSWTNPGTGAVYVSSPTGTVNIITYTKPWSPTPTTTSSGGTCTPGVDAGCDGPVQTKQPTQTKNGNHHSGSNGGNKGDGSTIGPAKGNPIVNGNIKDVQLNRRGWEETIFGAGALLGFIASFSDLSTIPVLDLLIAAARMLVKNAAAIIVGVLNKGLTDLANSYYNVDPGVLYVLDVVKVALDIFGIIVNVVTTINNFYEAFSLLGDLSVFGRALLDPQEDSNAGKAIGIGWSGITQIAGAGFNLQGDITNAERAHANADAVHPGM